MIVNVPIETNDPERAVSLVNAIDFNDKEQLALLLWTKVRDRKIKFREAARLAGITWDEMQDIYRHLDLLDYQMTDEEFEEETIRIHELISKVGPVGIRPVDLSSTTELSALKDMYHGYTHELLPYESSDRLNVSDEESWKMQFSDDTRHCWILRGDERVGFVFYRPVTIFERYWEIVQFYIVPSARRRGIGTAAVRELFSLVRNEEWADRIMYMVLKRNPANAFWEKALSELPDVEEPEVEPNNPEEVWHLKKGLLRREMDNGEI